jgi:hypothetical protein
MECNHASAQGAKNENGGKLEQDQFPICAIPAATANLQSHVFVPHPHADQIAEGDCREQVDAILELREVPREQVVLLQTWLHSFGNPIVQVESPVQDLHRTI